MNKEQRKKYFEKDEAEGISRYKKALEKAKGREKKTYKKILPDEEKHLLEIKKIK